MNAAKILLLALCCTMLAACARPRHPFPKPYVAVRGQPYYWEIDGDKVFNCFIISSSAGHGYQTRNDPCRFSHNGNFNATDLKGAGFLLDGAVIVESSVPLLIGPFGPISSYDKRVSFPIVIPVVEPDSPPPCWPNAAAWIIGRRKPKAVTVGMPWSTTAAETTE